jgi:hypothetical protein
MDFELTHRTLTRVNIDTVVERVSTVDPGLWDSDEFLRRRMATKRPSRSIFLYHTNPHTIPGLEVTQSDVRRCAGWNWFSPSVQPIIDDILSFYPSGGIVVICQIANLLPGGRIPQHFDAAPLLRASHRIHVPLITWPEVAFYIDDTPHHFEAGVAFELNNQRMHEVYNAGTKDRYHLILDLLPSGSDRTLPAASE